MNNIRQIVKERGYQLGYIAKRIGVHNSHMSMWISEDRYPSQEKLLKLARALKCSVKDLYPNVVRRTYWNIKGDENERARD
jgi:transcriptional regulator with XRE-family HTH domain